MFETDARSARLALERLRPPNAWRLPEGFADALERYVALLLERNRGVNLTRVIEPSAVARLHLLDSIAVLPLIDSVAPSRALDLGSGGGVPGLVLALARPAIAWTLVDSVGKKVDAMRDFVDDLAVANVEVVGERAEVLGRDARHRESYDLITARACAALPVLVEYALPLLRPGGVLVAWKGLIGDEELRAGAAAASLLGGLEPTVLPTGVPQLGDHCFVAVGKDRPTPSRYPRRSGEPARRPLG